MINNLLVILLSLFLFFICAVPILIVVIMIIGLIFLVKAKGISRTCKVLIIIIILLVIFIIFVNIYHEKSDDIYKKMNRINNDKSLIGLTKEEVVELLGKPKDEFDNEIAKGYKYYAGYLDKKIRFFGHTFWFKNYHYEFIVYFDEADRVESTAIREYIPPGG